MRYSLENYQKALKYSKDLKVLLQLIPASIRSYSQFNQYKSVQEILNILHQEQVILDLQLKKLEDIIKNKGKLNDEI